MCRFHCEECTEYYIVFVLWDVVSVWSRERFHLSAVIWGKLCVLRFHKNAGENVWLPIKSCCSLHRPSDLRNVHCSCIIETRHICAQVHRKTSRPKFQAGFESPSDIWHISLAAAASLAKVALGFKAKSFYLLYPATLWIEPYSPFASWAMGRGMEEVLWPLGQSSGNSLEQQIQSLNLFPSFPKWEESLFMLLGIGGREINSRLFFLSSLMRLFSLITVPFIVILHWFLTSNGVVNTHGERRYCCLNLKAKHLQFHP